jgi:hypothetical protein
MSNELSKKDIIDFSLDFDYAYSHYQMGSYVVDVNITDWRKAKQCLIEIEHRTQSIEDRTYDDKKKAAQIEIKKEELAQETSPARKKLLEIEIEEFQNHLERNRRRIGQIENERDRFIEEFKALMPDKTSMEDMKNNIEEKEREYWISRMGKQAAMEMLAYGKIGTGNLESIMHMPHQDQAKIIRGALEYTKQFETGIVAIEKDVEQRLLNMLKEKQDLDLVPKLEDTVQQNAKLLDSPES